MLGFDSYPSEFVNVPEHVRPSHDEVVRLCGIVFTDPLPGFTIMRQEHLITSLVAARAIALEHDCPIPDAWEIFDRCLLKVVEELNKFDPESAAWQATRERLKTIMET